MLLLHVHGVVMVVKHQMIPVNVWLEVSFVEEFSLAYSIRAILNLINATTLSDDPF